MSDAPRFASVLLAGPAPWRENLTADLAQCAGVEFTLAGNAAETVQALLTQSWTLVVFLLDADASALFEMAASLDGISKGRDAGGRETVRIGLRPGGFPSTAAVPAGMDRLEACPKSPAGWLTLLQPPEPSGEEGLSFDTDELIDRMMGNEMLAKRVVSVFLEDAPKQLLALSEALEREDAATGSRIAHSFRGSASNAGGDSLIELARGIESGCKAGELDQAKSMLPKLADRFTRLRPKLEAFIG